jgi:uncharacterized membrane protein
VEHPVLEYGPDKEPVPAIATISGWIGLASAAAIEPLNFYGRFPLYLWTAIVIAFVFGTFGAVMSRGRSIPAWGALAAIVVIFTSAGIETFII